MENMGTIIKAALVLGSILAGFIIGGTIELVILVANGIYFIFSDGYIQWE
jgi:hypothetical protein